MKKHFSRVLSVFLSLSMLFSFLAFPAAGADTADSAELAAEETVRLGFSGGTLTEAGNGSRTYRVDVTTTSSDDFLMYGGQIYVSFDKEKLAIQAIRAGTIAPYTETDAFGDTVT